MHMRRAGHGSAPPLNCGVSRRWERYAWLTTTASTVAAYAERSGIVRLQSRSVG
jgi:hypothetical protein